MITETDLAKYEVSFDQKPHMVSAGRGRTSWRSPSAVGYEVGESATDFNELYLKEVILAKAVAYNEFRILISQAEWYNKGYLANIVTYTIAKLVS